MFLIFILATPGRTNSLHILDVPNGSTQWGKKMQIYTCYKGNTNQLFTVTGDKRIAWTNKGECLDLTDGSTTPGNKVIPSE
jgi:hypothetical protein